MDWARVGLIFDIIGALLLSAEAIKVRNVQRFVVASQAFLSRFVVIRISEENGRPMIALGGLGELPPAFHGPPGEWSQRAKWGLIGFLATGAAVAVAVWLAFWLAPQIGGHPLWQDVLLVAALVATVVAGCFCLPFAVTAASALVLLIFEKGIDAVERFDRRTADGTVGILGAALLVIGFIFQFIAAG